MKEGDFATVHVSDCKLVTPVSGSSLQARSPIS